MRKMLILAIMLVFVGFTLLSPRSDTMADDKAAGDKPCQGNPENFVGAKSCKKCHNTAASGKQYAIWEAGPHAKAFELLGTDAAKATAKKYDIPDPQKSGKCLKCHSTAYYFTEENVAGDKLAVTEAVSCETCHAPGKGYQDRKVMKSREESIKGGMNPHPETMCVHCHNKNSPTWKDDRYTLKDGTKVGFDYEQASKKVAHPTPKK